MVTKTALITGASSGIGLELSKLFAADGYNLVLVARSTAKLEQLAKQIRQKHPVQITVLPKDLSEPQAPGEIFETIQGKGIHVDILVNNAGFGVQGDFSRADLDESLQMIQLNVASLTALTRLFLPAMLERKAGRILNVGSTGSFSPVPSMAVYGATKAYVLSFSEALAEELRGSGVSVTAFCPGMTITGFQERAAIKESGLLVRFGAMRAVDAARSGYKAMQGGKVVALPGPFNRLLALSIRFSPRGLTRRLSRWMMGA
ncbi:MAG: SDR family NAD(P)-dependent oxidoreductase [Chloroflexota bacterium]